MAERARADELAVWVTCVWCGDVRLEGRDVEFVYDADHGDFEVRFRCPQCRTRDAVVLDEPHRLGALFAAGLVPAVTVADADEARDGFVSWLAEPGRLEAEVARLRDSL